MFFKCQSSEIPILYRGRMRGWRVNIAVDLQFKLLARLGLHAGRVEFPTEVRSLDSKFKFDRDHNDRAAKAVSP